MRQQLGAATISVRRPRTGARTWRPWLLGWGGMVVAAVSNGVLREVLIRPVLGETWAKVVSTAILLAMLAAWQWWLLRRFPLPDARTAWRVGAAWTAMTLAFEFGWGGLVEHLTWSTMLADYDLLHGRVWLLVPAWLLVGPAALRVVMRRGSR